MYKTMEVIFFTAVSLIFMFLVIRTVFKQRAFEKESFYWIIGSMAMLVLAIKPDLIKILSKMVNIVYAPSLLFFLAIIFILYLLFKAMLQISVLREQNKSLAQEIVVLNKKIENISNINKKLHN